MIHGTKRSKKQPTQEEKQADDILSTKIRDNLHEFIAIRYKQKTDIPYLLQFTQILMELCSDISTIYNFRRQTIDIQLSNIENLEEKVKILEGNLKFVTKLMKSDPKSYNVWNFRKWLVVKLFELSNTNEIIDKQLQLCKMMLMKDQKNFHVWNYRHWLNQLHVDIDKALQFTQQKIKSNPFNFSPLHFRTKHITQKYQQLISRQQNQQVLQYGMPEKEFKEQLEGIKAALFINPNQEAPWMYYKWLLNLVVPCSVISITRISDLSYEIVTNSLISNLNQENLSIKTDTQLFGGFSIKSKNDKIPSNEWVIIFDKVHSIEPSIQVLSNFQYKLSYVKPEYGWLFIGTDKAQDKVKVSKTIIEQQIIFINELLQSENNRCRYASQCLLDLYQIMLYFHQTKSEWRQLSKNVNNILQNLSTETKGKKYIQKITQHWKALQEHRYSQLKKSQRILLSRLS